MSEVVHQQRVVGVKGSWRYGVPGAVALISAVAFVTGVFDEAVRTLLGEVLVGTLVSTIVFGALALYLRRGLVHELTVRRGEGVALSVDGASVRVALEPVRYSYGVFVELVVAGKAHRNVPVLWVQISSGAGPVVTIRKGLGIQHAVPRDWPEVHPRIEDPAHVFSGEPLPLERALARAGAERAEPLAHLAR